MGNNNLAPQLSIAATTPIPSSGKEEALAKASLKPKTGPLVMRMAAMTAVNKFRPISNS